MRDTSDMELLRGYARQNSETAFAELVRRHINLVYSAALRHVGMAAQAEEISQAVFVILAQKAASLREGLVLEAWLFETTRLTALSFLRGERRRQFREQEAYMQSILQQSTSDPAWQQLSPMLDEAMMRLARPEREAVVLRFFKDRSLGEVATALNIKEPAAQKRVERALEKLRGYFLKRGVSSTTAMIAGAVSANSVHAAPAGLADTISTAAFAKGAAASASTLTLVKGALKLMAWTNIKTAIVVSVGVLLVAGAAVPITIEEISHHREEAVWSQITRAIETRNGKLLRDLPPVVSIRRTQFYPEIDDAEVGGQSGKMLGLAVPAPGVFGHAFNVIRDRIINQNLLPAGRYDFAVMTPDHQSEALQAAAEKEFGVTATRETIQTNVLVLTVVWPGAPGLQLSTASRAYWSRPIWKGGYIKFENASMFMFTYNIERQYNIPIIDETGLTNAYDISVKWDRRNLNPDIKTVQQNLLDQLGLKLTPDIRPVDMLVLEKAK
jgi:uncharacterized protein (TIGR03435 family)